MHVLVCGGAGYIGSHMAKWLAAHDVTVTVLDDGGSPVAGRT